VVIEIIDNVTGDTVQRYASDDPVSAPVEGRNIPDYWIRPSHRLSSAPGLHRLVWNVRYAPPAVERFTYPIAAVTGNTPKTPQGIFVLPGTYQVRLTVDGRHADGPSSLHGPARGSTADRECNSRCRGQWMA
jgi:hypothetical protein